MILLYGLSLAYPDDLIFLWNVTFGVSFFFGLSGGVAIALPSGHSLCGNRLDISLFFQKLRDENVSAFAVEKERREREREEKRGERGGKKEREGEILKIIYICTEKMKNNKNPIA